MELTGFWEALPKWWRVKFKHAIRWFHQKEMKAATDGSLGNVRRKAGHTKCLRGSDATGPTSRGRDIQSNSQEPVHSDDEGDILRR